MGISFHFSGKPEKAPRLINSLGASKTRLHFRADYKKGKDKYAVFAKQILLERGKTLPEGKGRFIYHRVENSNVVYKINKASLQKRLGISSKELKSVTDHNYKNLIESKLGATFGPPKNMETLTKPQKILKTQNIEVPPEKTETLATQEVLKTQNTEVSSQEWKDIYKNYDILIENLDHYCLMPFESEMTEFNNAVELARGKGDSDLGLFHKDAIKKGDQVLGTLNGFKSEVNAIIKRIENQAAFVENLNPSSPLRKEMEKVTSNLQKISIQLTNLCSQLGPILTTKDFQDLINGRNIPNNKIKEMINSWELAWEGYTHTYRTLRNTVNSMFVDYNKNLPNNLGLL